MKQFMDTSKEELRQKLMSELVNKQGFVKCRGF